MFKVIPSCFVLSLVLSACGGGAPPDVPGGGGVGGGGGPGAPVLPTDPPPPAPTPSAPPASMLPGASFGCVNATGVPIVAYGWWETRPGADGLGESHWHWLIPVAGAIAPGASHASPLTNGPIPLPQPQVGPLAVAAYFADGTTRIDYVTFDPPALSTWRVD